MNRRLSGHAVNGKFKKLGLVLIAALYLQGCKQEETIVHPAFYHWQTNFSPAPEEYAYLDSLKVKRLYFKAFDVDWDEGSHGPVPLAPVENLASLDFEGELVPVVFITNSCMEHIDMQEVDDLASRIHKKLASQIVLAGISKVPEVQLDCDWTETTADRFFRLAQILKELLLPQNIRLSATIRLHQVRYFDKTGIPPVDRGMLMVYNTGTVMDWLEERSILDPMTVSPYLTYFDRYPLPLDVALPAYGWSVVFREGRLVKLVHGLRAEDLESRPAFLKLAEDRFELRESMYFKGQYFYQGDRFRTEAATMQVLEETARLLSPHFHGREYDLAFFHLNSATVKHYPYAALEHIVEIMDP